MRVRIEVKEGYFRLELPEEELDKLGWRAGQELDLQIETDHILISALGERRYNLEALVSAITPENRHDETDWSEAQGQEVW